MQIIVLGSGKNRNKERGRTKMIENLSVTVLYRAKKILKGHSRKILNKNVIRKYSGGGFNEGFTR